MTDISTIFCDVGGVVLNNGWDHPTRRRAAEKFGLDWDDFEERHASLVDALETGRVNLDRYLDLVVFGSPRSFTRDEFRNYIFSQSKTLPETAAVIAAIARSGCYLMCSLNNESLDLNQHRITSFHLCGYFTLFLSSCFLGVKKPDAAIFRMALQVTQRRPEECLFIDDRALNLEAARQSGIRTVQCRNSAQLREELEKNGVKLTSV